MCKRALPLALEDLEDLEPAVRIYLSSLADRPPFKAVSFCVPDPRNARYAPAGDGCLPRRLHRRRRRRIARPRVLKLHFACLHTCATASDVAVPNCFRLANRMVPTTQPAMQLLGHDIVLHPTYPRRYR